MTDLSFCPFCGHLAAKITSHYVRSLGHQKYYARCKICSARGPLANTEDLAVQFWNYTGMSDHHTKSWHYDDLRYKTK